MKRAVIGLLVFFASIFFAAGASGQTTASLTVTSTPISVTATSAGYFAVLYENSAVPTATYSVTAISSSGSVGTTLSVSPGAGYVFTRPAGSPFRPGDFLGTVVSISPGPYNFVLAQFTNAPNAPQVSAVKCPTGAAVTQINPDGTTVCSETNPVAQWNSSLGAITFTAPSGTSSAPVWFTNASPLAQSLHAGTEFLENTDGQFEIITMTDGIAQALLNLDTDGHVALYGSSGGGLATDLSGNTCLASNNGSCWNVVFAGNGPLVNYQGVALKSGHGMPVILDGGSAVLSGNFGPYTLYTTPATGYTATGLFRLNGYVVETSAVPGATLQVRIDYTDDSGAASQDTGMPLPFGTAGAKLPFSFILQSMPSQAINITINTTGAPSYTIYAVLEAL